MVNGGKYSNVFLKDTYSFFMSRKFPSTKKTLRRRGRKDRVSKEKERREKGNVGESSSPPSTNIVSGMHLNLVPSFHQLIQRSFYL